MNASARKAQAKGTRKCRQVFNFRVLASPFGNGVTQYGLELEGSVSLRANRRKKRDHYAKKTFNCVLIQKTRVIMKINRVRKQDVAYVTCFSIKHKTMVRK